MAQKPTNSLEPRLGWHSRGYLPHFDGGELAQFLTFRLHDALPQSVLVRWREEQKLTNPGEAEAIMRRRVEAYLDQGHGSCYLKDPSVAGMVQDALLFHDQKKYRLAAWVVMPNHVHLLCTPCVGQTLPRIMHSLKSFTSNEINKLVGRTGRLWEREYYDRIIRDSRDYDNTIRYILDNPAKAGLHDWRWVWPRF